MQMESIVSDKPVYAAPLIPLCWQRGVFLEEAVSLWCGFPQRSQGERQNDKQLVFAKQATSQSTSTTTNITATEIAQQNSAPSLPWHILFYSYQKRLLCWAWWTRCRVSKGVASPVRSGRCDKGDVGGWMTRGTELIFSPPWSSQVRLFAYGDKTNTSAGSLVR